jgi:hypothetical protein
MVAIRQFKLPELYSVRNASSIQWSYKMT